MPRPNGPQFNQQPLERWVWVDGEPFTREEIHQAAGFKERTPEYLLEKHKEKQAKRKK